MESIKLSAKIIKSRANQWDNMVDIFGSSVNEGSIPECAADNMVIAWPSVLSCIRQHLAKTPSAKALDFGCGGGLFCQELHRMGFNTVGFEPSEELLQAAQQNTPEAVSVSHLDDEINRLGRYDLISSIMVLQFIDDIEPVIERFVSLLNPGGLIVFVVFNPEFIQDNQNSSVFSGFETYRTGYMALKPGVKVPVFNRSAADYRKYFEDRGFQQVYIDYPIFTDEFLARYQMPFSTEKPEFLIQGFKLFS